MNVLVNSLNFNNWLLKIAFLTFILCKQREISFREWSWTAMMRVSLSLLWDEILSSQLSFILIDFKYGTAW